MRLAEQRLESKRHLRPWTRKNYCAALDNVLIPRFGHLRVTAITPEHVAELIRELEPAGKPLSSSTRNGRPLGNVRRRGFEVAAARAGIAGVTFHSMRHAFGSRMISRGINSTIIERRYVHLFGRQRTDDQVRQAVSVASAS